MPTEAAPDELGYTMKALDERRAGGALITVNPAVAVLHGGVEA
ncbi:hypothetical protein [Microbacterium sp.]